MCRFINKNPVTQPRRCITRRPGEHFTSVAHAVVTKFLSILAVVCLLAVTAHAANDDARFKPKEYKESKRTANSAFKGKGYTPSKQKQASDSTYKRSKRAEGWSLFKSKRAERGEKLQTEALADIKPYKQEKHTVVPTTKADPRAIEEKKPFVKSEQELPAEVFKPAEKSEWKNPLLKPRQSVKEFNE